MIINGHDGSKYRVYESYPIKQVEQWIVGFKTGLKYNGPDKTVKFYVEETRGNNVTCHEVEYHLRNGYEWDGASIPKRFQWLIGKPTAHEFRVSSLFHDLGYENRSRRVLNDVIFYYLLSKSEVPHWKADMMYKAVRPGGHIYYASDTSRFWRKIKGLL